MFKLRDRDISVLFSVLKVIEGKIGFFWGGGLKV